MVSLRPFFFYFPILWLTDHVLSLFLSLSLSLSLLLLDWHQTIQFWLKKEKKTKKWRNRRRKHNLLRNRSWPAKKKCKLDRGQLPMVSLIHLFTVSIVELESSFNKNERKNGLYALKLSLWWLVSTLDRFHLVLPLYLLLLLLIAIYTLSITLSGASFPLLSYQIDF